MSFASPRFEGSFMGSAEKISADAVLECKICWTPYDPAVGDETRQIAPGTPFLALPHDWKCPTCDGAKEQFMVLSGATEPGATEQDDDDRIGDDADAGRQAAELMAAAVELLVLEFREIHNSTMRGGPMSNKSLHVEAVGFKPWQDQFIGVLIAPWFMNLILLPGPDQDWSGLVTGEKELIPFPSGVYEFIHVTRDGIGGYKACSLFSPMGEFSDQLYATDVARAVMVGLFDEDNREGTDEQLTVRRLREAELEQARQMEAAATDDDAADSNIREPAVASRRAFITAGLDKAPSQAAGAGEQD